MKIKYIFLYISLLVVCFSCQKQEQKNVLSENQDIIISKKEPDLLADKRLEDSLKNVKAQQFKEWQRKNLVEKFRIMSNPVPEKWLRMATRHNKDSLPSSIASYFFPIFERESWDTLRIDNPKVEYFEILEGNLDEDEERERVLYFQYEFSFLKTCHTLLLDKKNNKWYPKDKIINLSKWNGKSEIDTAHKMLITRSNSWGSGGYFAEVLHFHEYQSDTLHEVWSYPKEEANGAVYGYGPLSEKLKCKHLFISDDTIKVISSYNLFRACYQKDTIPQIDILKNKEMYFFLKRNKNTREFEMIDSTKSKYLASRHVCLDAFRKSYDKEIVYLSEYGTNAQKQVLAMFKLERSMRLERSKSEK